MTTARERRARRRAEARGEAFDPARVHRTGRRTREARAIETVACPTCDAPVGQACRTVDGRPLICSSRRTAWQMVRAGEIT